MTLLTAVQSAAIRVIGRAPAAVMSSVDQIAIELRDLAGDVAIDIARSAEWRALVEVGTMAGGSSFPLPADYDRMMTAARVQDGTSWFWGYSEYASVDDYIAATTGQLALADPGGWIILGGEMRFWPATTGTATFPYLSKMLVRSEIGARKETFTADDDVFVLDERLLTLGLVWRWRQQKRLEYAEDLETYGFALAERQNADKGARVLRPDAGRMPGARRAYAARRL